MKLTANSAISLAASNDSSNIAIIVFASILLVLLVGGIVWLIVIHFKNKKRRSLKTNEPNNSNSNTTKGMIGADSSLSNYLNNLENELNSLKNQYKQKIIDLNKFDENQIRSDLITLINQELEVYKSEKLKQVNQEIELNKQTLAQQLILQTIEQLALDVVNESSVVSIDIKEDIKSRIIGKKGRNKKKFESITGCDLVVEKDPTVTISCLNPIRKEIGIRTIKHLIDSNAFDELAIENVYKKEKKAFEQELSEIGKQTTIELNIKNIDSELYEFIGRLKYRSSYGQNILNHSIECALISREFSKQLSLNEDLATKCAFFHDIGKSNDYEINIDHIQQGVALAKKYNLDPIIVNAIANHHNPVSNNQYELITRIADTISAGRIGARINSYEDVIERVNEIESICKKHPEVIDAYALKAGRYLKVMINPVDVNSQQVELLAYEIKKELEENPNTNKFEIEIAFYQTNEMHIKTDKKIN